MLALFSLSLQINFNARSHAPGGDPPAVIALPVPAGPIRPFLPGEPAQPAQVFPARPNIQ
jgi:hypothetical protein